MIGLLNYIARVFIISGLLFVNPYIGRALNDAGSGASVETSHKPIVAVQKIIGRQAPRNEDPALILVVVTDLLGQERYSKIELLTHSGVAMATDPSGRLSPGVYMVMGTSQDKLYKKKLVIR